MLRRPALGDVDGLAPPRRSRPAPSTATAYSKTFAFGSAMRRTYRVRPVRQLRSGRDEAPAPERVRVLHPPLRRPRVHGLGDPVRQGPDGAGKQRAGFLREAGRRDAQNRLRERAEREARIGCSPWATSLSAGRTPSSSACAEPGAPLDDGRLLAPTVSRAERCSARRQPQDRSDRRSRTARPRRNRRRRTRASGAAAPAFANARHPLGIVAGPEGMREAFGSIGMS